MDLKLGSVITTQQSRDAIHIAVAPVVAGEDLKAGQHIGFMDGVTIGNDVPVGTGASALIGIVDPFLKAKVKRGQRFWLFLYPQTVTSLRHEWEHPAFARAEKAAAEAKRADSEEWLRNFAGDVGLTYEQVIQAGQNFLSHGEYFVQSGNDSARDAFYDDGQREAYWNHFANVTGEVASESSRKAIIFSCSC